MESPLSARVSHLPSAAIRVGIAVFALCLGCAFAQAGPDVGADRVYKISEGASPPKPIYTPDPDYSKEARQAKYQGTCVLRMIVGADGRPHDIKVSASLGHGLDEKAIEAVKQWKFQPAMKDGKPVAVEISVQVDFHLWFNSPAKNRAPSLPDSLRAPTPPQAHVDPTPQFTKEQLARIAALWDAKPSPEQQAELRTKCAAYIDKSFEDLKAKRVPPPPHECAGVLGWMRTLDVESLYVTEDAK
jgi:TonB family protein